MINQVRYRLYRSRRLHPQAWLVSYVVLAANLFAVGLLAAHNAGIVK